MQFSHRPDIVVSNGIVTSGHHLASIAGVDILKRGGNAVDAAIAAAAVLCVVRPHSVSLGGDVFMLIYDATEGKVTALNASGPAPQKASRRFFLDRGEEKIPLEGMVSASVPGLVDGWARALEAYGSMTFDQVLQSAIEYAEKGFPMYQKLCDVISKNSSLLARCPSSKRVFLAKYPPRPGKLLVQEDLASSLRKIASGGRDAFYRGEIAEAIDRFSAENGGLITKQDLARYQSEFYEPISTTYRGFEVFEQPPVSQGLILLQELNIVEGFDLARLGHNSAESIHLMVEAKKLAFEDRLNYISDPDFVDVPLQRLLSKEHAAEQRARIDPNRAMSRGKPADTENFEGDTTYLAVVDKEGNAVSLIESIYSNFGCGSVVEGTGVLLNNRLSAFSLLNTHVNRLEPGKKTTHTLNNYIVFRDGALFLVGGTPGADDQVQSNLQIIVNVIDHGMSIQQAIEAPRWSSRPGTAPGEESLPYELQLERRIPNETRKGLERRGHLVKVVGDWSFGGAEAVLVDPASGALMGGADPRRDGYAIGW